MRIISPYSDYYDSAQSHGQDQSIIYQRKMVEYKDVDSYKLNDKTPQVIRDLYKQVYEATTGSDERVRWYYSAGLPNTIFGKPNSFNVSSGIIVFCGKMYQYVALHRDVVAMSPTSSSHYFYDSESFIDFCIANKLKIIEKAARWDKSTIEDRVKKKFDKKGEINNNWLIENKVICADVTKHHIIINPKLKDRQFFKVMETYTAFQSLDMWICGTLSYPQNAMVMLDDKSMIAKHGFDEWSFRKQPEGYGIDGNI